MNQIEKLKHFKENEVETDYIKVYDRSLNKTDVKENVVNETNIKEHEEEKIVKTLPQDKKTADRMARGGLGKDNVVFGTKNGITDYRSFGEYDVSFIDEDVENDLKAYIDLPLNETISILFKITRQQKMEIKKLHDLIKALANDLKKYKEKVGIK